MTFKLEPQGELAQAFLKKGMKYGIAHGEAIAVLFGKTLAVLNILTVRGLPITNAQEDEIRSCQDLTILEHWLKRADKAKTTEKVLQTVVLNAEPKKQEDLPKLMTGKRKSKDKKERQIEKWSSSALVKARQYVRERGRRDGERSVALRLLKRRFGDLPTEVLGSIHRLDLEQLEVLGKVVLDMTKLTDLTTWLDQNDYFKESSPSLAEQPN